MDAEFPVLVMQQEVQHPDLTGVDEVRGRAMRPAFREALQAECPPGGDGIECQALELVPAAIELALLRAASGLQSADVFLDSPAGFMPLADLHGMPCIGFSFGAQQQPVE